MKKEMFICDLCREVKEVEVEKYNNLENIYGLSFSMNGIMIFRPKDLDSCKVHICRNCMWQINGFYTKNRIS